MSEVVAARNWLRTFQSLRHRNFRLLWLAQVASSSGMWMEIIARNLLVYEMTGSSTALALLNLFRALPQLLFTLGGGILADRIDRKKIVIVCFGLNALLTLLLALLILTDQIELWHIYVTGALMGAVGAMQQPAGQGILPNTVPEEDLLNAISLNSGAMSVTRMYGPPLASLVILWLGYGGAYLVKVIIFFIPMVLYGMIWLPPQERIATTETPIQNIKSGAGYVWHNPEVRLLLIVGLLPLFFGMPWFSLLPALATEKFGENATVYYGFLYSGVGLGATAILLTLATLGDFRGKGKVLLVGAFVFGLAIMALSASNSLATGFASMVGVGIGMNGFWALTSTLLQKNIEDDYRGRVMAIFGLDWTLTSAAAVVAGIIADSIGTSITFAIMASGCLIVSAVTWVMAPSVRRMD